MTLIFDAPNARLRVWWMVVIRTKLCSTGDVLCRKECFVIDCKRNLGGVVLQTIGTAKNTVKQTLDALSATYQGFGGRWCYNILLGL